MFFKNYLIFLFLKFFWWGLAFGMFGAVCSLTIKLCRRNVYISNLTSFCFWLAFGGVFAGICMRFYNYTFCWFGLLAMLAGLFLVKLSVEFFFTIIAKLLYNKIVRKNAKEARNGKFSRIKFRSIHKGEKA